VWLRCFAIGALRARWALPVGGTSASGSTCTATATRSTRITRRGAEASAEPTLRLPPRPDGLLARNGYALVTDLEHEGYAEVAAGLERFQVDFLAATRSVWRPDFPIPPDALGHFSRQWEYPYAWANLSRGRGRLLDAGSGLTFLPFLFAAAGLDVMCCDPDGEGLGYSDRFEEAARLTGLPVGFTRCTLEEPPFRDAAFDAVVCVSVLEHVRPPRDAVLASLARIIAPGGRVVLTCDVDLRAPGDLPLEDLGALLTAFERHFEPVFPIDLRRPPSLLTSERFVAAEQWRLPPVWRSLDGSPREPFRSLAVLGLTGIRRADRR
jgi:SAM-dependent methyltransferase